MAKGDRAKVSKQIEADRTDYTAKANPFYQDVDTARREATPRNLDERNQLWSGYSDLSKGGLFGQEADRLRGAGDIYNPFKNQTAGSGGSSGGGGGGGYSGPAGPSAGELYGAPYAGFSEFSQTGGVDLGKLEESLGTFRDLAGKNAGFDEARLANINKSTQGLRDIGQTGGYDPAQLAAIRDDLNTLSGYGSRGTFSDPELRARILSSISGLQETPESLTTDVTNKIRGTGYDEFARTGGYSDSDISNIRDRSNSVIPSLYAQTANDMSTLAARQGGYSPGIAAALAKSRRGLGQAASESARDTELGISDRVREGRKFGITGLRDTEMSIADLNRQIMQNRTAALGQAGDIGSGFYKTLGDLENTNRAQQLEALKNSVAGRTGVESDLVNNKLAGLKESGTLDLSTQELMNRSRQAAGEGIQKTHYDAQGLVQKGRQFGLTNMMQVEEARRQASEREASARASAAAAAAAGDRESAAAYSADAKWWADFDRDNQQFIMSGLAGSQEAGLAGMGKTYTSAPGETAMYLDTQSNLLNSIAGNRGNITGQQQQNIGPSVMDRIMQGAGIAASVAPAFFGAPTSGGNRGISGVGTPVSGWTRP